MMNRLQTPPFTLLSVALTFLLIAPIGATLLPVQSSHAASSTRQIINDTADPERAINELAATSQLVIRGRVMSQTTLWNDDRAAIVTDSVVDVRYLITGSAMREDIQTATVRTLGGELAAENLGMAATHTPTLSEGEEVLLYLQVDGDHFVISQGEAGKFAVYAGQAHNEHLGIHMPLGAILNATRAVAGQPVNASLPTDWAAEEAQAAGMSTEAPATPNQYVYEGIHWPGNQPTIPFYINPTSGQSGSGDGDQTAFLNAVLAGASTWNNVPTAAFTFNYAGKISQRTVALNGINEVVFTDQGAGGGVLGQTSYWYTLPGKEVIEADVWFNDAYDLDASGAPGGNEIDLESVALHEFGHWLVLGHDDNSNAIMYFAISAGTLKRSLYQTDIDGISTIYPCGNSPCLPGQAPDPTATPAETPTPVPTATPTFTPTFTDTPLPPPTATFTPTFTPLPTETPTEIPTNAPLPTPTFTPPFTDTPLPPPTATFTPTFTPTAVNTATFTPTFTPVPGETEPPLPTATLTPTFTPIVDDGPTPSPMPTFTPTAISEPTATPTDSAADAPEVHRVSTAGGTVSYGGDGETGLTVDIPPGAVDEAVDLAYLENGEPGQTPGTSFQFAGFGFNLDAARAGEELDGLNFNQPVTFAMNYPASAEVNEENLALFYFDTATQSWQPATCGISALDAVTNSISVQVCHLTEFALFSHDVELNNRIFMPVVRK